MTKKYELCLVSGAEGPCVILNDFRIAGPKPWGGGTVTKRWTVDQEDLISALRGEICSPLSVEEIRKVMETNKWLDREVVAQSIHNAMTGKESK